MLFLTLDGDGQKEQGNPMRSPMGSIMNSFIMSLGIFGSTWDLIAQNTDHPYIGQVRE